MNILVTLDSNYMKPLKVMLKSLFINNSRERFTIFVMHSRLSEFELAELRQLVSSHGNNLQVITVDKTHFAVAPTLMHYTKEMYYLCLAFKLLPKGL